MSTTINPTTPSAHRIHRDGTSGDLVLTTPAYRPRLVGPAPVLPGALIWPRAPAAYPPTAVPPPARAAAPMRPSRARPMWCPQPATTA